MTDRLMRIEMPKDVKGISRRTFIKGVGAMLAWSALLTVDHDGITKTATAAPLSNTPSELRRSTLPDTSAKHSGSIRDLHGGSRSSSPRSRTFPLQPS
jgi:hypothetical protein